MFFRQKGCCEHYSSEIRARLEELWFTAPLSEVRMNPPEIRANNNGEKFQIRLEENETTFNVFVSPRALIKVNVFSDKGMWTEEQELYPGDVAGSWVLIRDKRTGKPLRIRYYFVKNSEVYIQFTPQGKIALADLVIFGNYAARGVPTGMAFEKFYSASFEDVMTITETKLPWNYVLVDPQVYHSMKQMCAVIHEKLPSISYVEDAMYDENRELVHISTGKKFEIEKKSDKSEEKLLLSSAGFVKWIADGLVEPISGGVLMREPLIKETVSLISGSRFRTPPDIGSTRPSAIHLTNPAEESNRFSSEISAFSAFSNFFPVEMCTSSLFSSYIASGTVVINGSFSRITAHICFML